MDLSNFNEVTTAISAIDSNVGFNIQKQMEIAKQYQKVNSFDYRDNSMEELVENFALKTLLIMKKDRSKLAYNKVDFLFEKFRAIPEEKTTESDAAYESYSDAADSATDLSAEADEIENFLNEVSPVPMNY